jgi:uncharacterized protein YbjT (DUF2867 family)
VKILVVGASGYIGGRLVPLLLEHGHDLVLLGRNVRLLEARFPGTQIVQGDLLEPESLPPALVGIEVAYYLAHSMGSSAEGFAERDLRAAASFASAAGAAGVRQIVYLGGLGEDNASLSHHLASRHDTGAELARHGVPVTEFRAAIVIGAGSASFEILRHLAERLPIMITPRWVATRCQPIAIRDVLDYLVAASNHPEITGIVEIGGPDVLSYGQMMLAYARQRRLRRWMIPVPFLTPRLSSYWVNLVSPVPASIARPLIEGLRNEVIVRNPGPAQGFGLHPVPYADALALAIERTDRHDVESTWFDAYRHARRDGLPENPTGEGMLVDRRVVEVAASAGRVFAEVERVGGATGWPYADLLWRIRGAADRVIGGVGMRLGRRDPDHVRVGDAVDFWRVEDVRPAELLRLAAEMKLPGRAWLQYEVIPGADTSHSTLVQTAFFEPHGLGGLAYWYGLAPIHPFIFRGMAAELAARATR